ncbi:MAG: hypothetical protein MZV49_10005 [Rhodopseudomonas palustris]|nr:hypothetical protein [Rhodopseudomonas palustris]
MSHSHAHRAAEPASAKTDPAQKATLFGTLLQLWPYIWPGDRLDLKMRVVWAVLLLIAAKIATMTVPFTFKWAVDGLTGEGSAPVDPNTWMLWLIASAADHDGQLRRDAGADGAADAVARRHVRQGGDACGAQAGAA